MLNVRELVSGHACVICVDNTLMAMIDYGVMRAEITMKVCVASTCPIDDVNLMLIARISQVPLVPVLNI